MSGRYAGVLEDKTRRSLRGIGLGPVPGLPLWRTETVCARERSEPITSLSAIPHELLRRNLLALANVGGFRGYQI